MRLPTRGSLARLAAQRHAVRRGRHRPWPAPRGRWLVGQSWEDLLFAHWPVDGASLRRHVPATLDLDAFEGTYWVGIVPFAMRGVHFAWCPPVPGTSSFAEVNLRTYVVHEGRPGVFFLTLEAQNPVALMLGRRVYGLPYRRAALSLCRAGEALSFSSLRPRATGRPAAFAAEYEPCGSGGAPVPGTHEHWLTERYCFYTAGETSAPRRTEVHHAPWPLQPARAEITRNTLGEAFGLELAGEPLLHFSRFQDVVAWPPGRV